MKRLYTQLPHKHSTDRRVVIRQAIKGACLSPLYYCRASLNRTPGIRLHRRAMFLGLRALLSRHQRMPYHYLYQLLFAPLDSVRYLEFDFLWRTISTYPHIGRYLDVSSPRLFPVAVISNVFSCCKAPALLLNPDRRDLNLTQQLLRSLRLDNRCQFVCKQIQDAQLLPDHFDTITSISVIEHIPDDSAAIQSLWTTLRSTGHLLLTVPCAAEAFEEYIDFNEYGLLDTDRDGFTFGQRFYDENLLQERVFSITGRPTRFRVFGEIAPGLFARDRDGKLGDPTYPFWKQPYMVAHDYREYRSIRDLPGWGVIAMEFVKA